MRKILAALAVVALLLGTVPAMAHTADDPYVTQLFAGQNIDVGEVRVWNDTNNLYVRYITEGDWCLSETHLDVATDPDNIPQKNENPIPGHFEYGMEHACVTDYTYEVPLAWEVDTDLYIAAHATVEKVLVEAPYPAASVVEYEQGSKKDGTAVKDARSDPEQGLVFETGKDESNFFSLGFGGRIIVEFDCPIPNREGNEVKVVEDTWGSYPVEKADVHASQDGEAWTYLGEADNTNQDGIHTISELDLDGLDWAKYIKIVDTTDSGIHNSDSDGYDLNAVLALQDCVQEETAWGDGYDFPGRNWATYFTYTVQEACPYEPGLVNGGFESPDVTGDPWGIFTSDQVGWTVEWVDDYEGAPDDAYLEIHTSGTVVDAYEGDQYVELDTDWEGVGSPGGEQASVKIYQDLATCPGQEYTLTYAWRGRPGYTSEMQVSFDNDYSASHTDNSEQWNPVEVTVTASKHTTRLEFVETGPADSFGMFLDAVNVTKN